MPYTLPALAAALALVGTTALARDNVVAAGSSTVRPFADAVAANFTGPAPEIASGGSSGGLRLFCEGVGVETTDIAHASRPIKSSEIAACAANGVTDIIEIRFGYDGVVFASGFGGAVLDMAPADYFNALAAQLPVNGALQPNPNMMWSDVNPNFFPQPLSLHIPGPIHGTRELLDGKMMEEGCVESGAFDEFVKILGRSAAEDACLELRADGVMMENNTPTLGTTITMLQGDINGVGAFSLNLYLENFTQLQPSTVKGVFPSAEAIADGSYHLGRPLYFYVKAAHLDVVPSLRDWVNFFLSDAMAGPNGALQSVGLVSDPALADTRAAFTAGTTIGQ
ncbi:MAG: substrate-binding domain-containing protein [Marivivens sp.]|nr:substrate-binding domain-containing protein [Marivivens sp.]